MSVVTLGSSGDNDTAIWPFSGSAAMCGCFGTVKTGAAKRRWHVGGHTFCEHSACRHVHSLTNEQPGLPALHLASDKQAAYKRLNAVRRSVGLDPSICEGGESTSGEQDHQTLASPSTSAVTGGEHCRPDDLE
eukprot:scaffold7503_cov146-Isochrysis_galbana.AAC.1